MPSLSGLGTPERKTGSVTEPESELAGLSRRFEQFQQFAAEKTKFEAELLSRIELLIQERETLQAERKRDYDFVNTWQTERQQYEMWYKNVARSMADNSFVMVLIDGDGMIFNDSFIQQGETGGLRAASQLYTAVQGWAETEVNNIPIGTRIVCRMYANVRGLGDVLVRTGVIEELGVFEDFVRGFTRGKSLFDFVDVGAGKDRADKKIIESFNMFSQDMHCRRVLFGCSHDNGYARALEECMDKPNIVDKVVLLEGVPFEKELLALPYTTKKFPGLFRDFKIVVNGAATSFYTTPVKPYPDEAPKMYNMLAGMPSRLPAPVRNGIMDSPLPTKAALAMTNTLPRTPSSSTIASDGFQPAIKPSVKNWAALAAAPAPPHVEQIPIYKPVSREEVIARNRAGQRVDPPCKDYDKTEVDRIKRIKMCNVHFLKNECPYDSNCTHLHAYKPTKDELQTLRLVARMAPCTNGSGCQDIKCIYGHRCPAPTHRNGPIKGTKSCIFGEQCKFPPELHDIDMNVVKTLVIR